MTDHLQSARVLLDNGNLIDSDLALVQVHALIALAESVARIADRLDGAQRTEAGADRLEAGPHEGTVKRRRSKVNDENLERIAAIVREHPKAHYERADSAASREAYAAICEEFHLGSIRTAQLWVKRAKDRGLR